MTLPPTIFKKSTSQKKSNLNAFVSKFDIDVMKVMVNLGSSFKFFIEPTSPLLHTMSQGHQPSGSGDENYQRVFTIYGHVRHLDHVTRTICMKFD